MSNINFDNPWLLLAGIPLLLLVLIPFAIAIRKENKNIHNVLSFICHLLIVVAVVLALAGMGYDAMITETNVYVLADVSHSSSNNLDVLDGYVKAVENQLPKNSKISLIAFGRNYQMLSDMGEELVSVKNADQVDTSATDIAGALRYAGNLFDEDVIKRIVVITDGNETVGGDKLNATVTKLKEEDIYIDVVYLNNNIVEGINEIQLTDVQYTAAAFAGTEEKAQLQINCNNEEATRIYVDVECNGETKNYAHILYKGQNLISVPLNTENTGKYEYTISVRPEKAESDTSLFNNACLVTQNVSEKVNILFLGGTNADCTKGSALYKANQEKTSEIVYNVQYMTDPSEVPYTVEELCKYDEIVLSNFDVRTMINSQAFVSSLDTVVSKFGKTLTTYGNTYVQETLTKENESLSALGGMLPVTMGNPDQDTRLVTILLDISTSTNQYSRLAVVKDAAKKIIMSLNENDMVSIIGYAGDIKELYPAAYLRNKEEVLHIIDAYTNRNGTLLESSMNYAYERIRSQKFHHRELIIISDGLLHSDDEAACITLAENMSGQNVVVSALEVVPSEENTLLKRIVQNANVNDKRAGYYKAIETPDDANYVIDSIVEEQTEVRIEGDFKLSLVRPQEVVLQGVKTLENLNGFWYSAAKSGATTVVTAEYWRDKTYSTNVPVYSYWSYGSGRVASFLSDISSDWTKNWDKSAEKGNEIQFLSNIASTMLPDEQVESPFLIATETDGNITKVIVTTSTFRNDAKLVMSLKDPDGGSQTKTMYFDSSDYICEFETSLIGRYSLHLEYDYANLHYEVDRGFEISYYPEYDAFTTYNVASLYRIISENGEVSLDGQLKMDNSDSATRSYSFSFIVPLMAFCVVLFVVDIIIRMIRWKDIRSLFIHERKRTEKQSN